MKTVYKIDAWCICKDEATMNSIANTLLGQLQTQKTNGNVSSGMVTKNTTDTPDTVVVNTTV